MSAKNCVALQVGGHLRQLADFMRETASRDESRIHMRLQSMEVASSAQLWGPTKCVMLWRDRKGESGGGSRAGAETACVFSTHCIHTSINVMQGGGGGATKGAGDGAARWRWRCGAQGRRRQ